MNKADFFKKIATKENSQKKVVEILKSSYPNAFSGLDENTYNRWVNGKTTPSLYKKMLMLLALGLPLVELYKSEIVNISSREQALFTNYLDKLNQKLIFGGYLPYSNCIRVDFLQLNKEQHRNEFDSFYSNNSAFIRIRNSPVLEENDYTFDSIIAYMGDTKVGHIAYTENIEPFAFSVLNIDKRKFSEHMCIAPMYYLDSDVLHTLISEFLKSFLVKETYRKTIKALVFVANPISATFFENALKGKRIKYYPPCTSAMKYDKGLYLYEIDVIYMLSIPYIMNLVQKLL